MTRSHKPGRGLMLVLSSPSGAGKTTLSRMLLQAEPRLALSISVTTRQRRQSEVDGVHYHFIDPKRFGDMREAGELLEWAEVHGNLYATPRGPVEAALAAGEDMLFDIDWQGTRQLKQAMPEDVVGVFVLPPSIRELRARLERRAEDPSEVIDRRLANARAEIAHWSEYDYVIVNRDLQETLAAAREILAAERAARGQAVAPGVGETAATNSRENQPELATFVARLLAEA
jgi:guanylate kinase